MREEAFWDSSALVPLCVPEPAREWAEAFADKYNLNVWWTARVEVRSAIARLERERKLPSTEILNALEALQGITRAWNEVMPSDELRLLAVRMLSHHGLRAADSLQLAAAMVWCRERPKGRAFLCADSRLAEAARREGFTVLQP